MSEHPPRTSLNAAPEERVPEPAHQEEPAKSTESSEQASAESTPASLSPAEHTKRVEELREKHTAAPVKDTDTKERHADGEHPGAHAHKSHGGGSNILAFFGLLGSWVWHMIKSAPSMAGKGGGGGGHAKKDDHGGGGHH